MKMSVTDRTRPMTAKTSRVAGREGFVLPAVVFALAIMGVLAVASLRTADDELRSSRAVRESGAALYAAEAGANVVRGTVTDSLLGTTMLDTLTAALAPGASVDLGWLALPDGASYKAVIRRMDNGGGSQTTYILSVEGRGAGLWGGQRAITMALTAVTIILPALTSAIGVVDGAGAPPLAATFNGNSWDVQGKDTEMQSAVSNPANIPAGCTVPTSENKPGFGLSSAESATIFGDLLDVPQREKFKGLKKGSTVNEYGVKDSYDDVTTTTAEELQALVDALSPGATLLTDTSINWDLGTVDSPGIFLADGDLTFTGNGYGVLIVTGDFKVTGNALWEGLVLVVGTGNASFTGSSNKIFGAILVANTKGGTTDLYVAGNAAISYSSQAVCRLEQAGLFDSGFTLVSGSWMQLSL